MEKSVTYFFKTHRKTTLPLLIAFSGGEDSLALVHLLLDLGISFQLAHFDHGWRIKSTQEAESLARFARAHDLVFHIGKSKSGEKKELKAREERYAFLQQVWKQSSFEAIVLGHHRQDQVETILKRVLEGAGLVSLKGMQEVSYREAGLVLWRPLLLVEKKDILSYLDRHHLTPIDDHTNRDLRFLRARMRQNIVPDLESAFGKKVGSSLCRLGKYAQELDHYLAHLEKKGKIPSLDGIIERGPWGLLCDFSQNIDPFLRRHLLAKFFHLEGINISFEVAERALEALATKKANHRLVIKEGLLVFDRGILFFFMSPPEKFQERISLQWGTWQTGSWQISVRLAKKGEEKRRGGGWREVWKGNILYQIPINMEKEREKKIEKYALAPIPPGRELRKKWNERAIPAVLREMFPALYHVEEMVKDLFSLEEGQTSSSHLLEIDLLNFSRCVKTKEHVKLRERE